MLGNRHLINRKLAVALILLTTLLYIFCCSNGNKPRLNEITIAQWGQERYLIYLPLYLAEEEGFFAAQGIDIKIKFSGNDDQVFASVLKGEASFGVGDPVFTAISRERGAKGKVVASIVDGVAIWGVTNNPNIGKITSKEDLRGLKVGTFPEPSTNYTLMKNTILEGGDDLKDTKIVQAPIGAQIALIENGAADIAMELEPGTSIAESKGYKVVYSSPEFYGPFAFTGLTTTEGYIQSNRDMVQKVVSAIENALQFAHQNEQQTIEIAQKLFPGLEKNVVAIAVTRMLSEKTIPQHAVMSSEAWQKALQIRLQVGDLKEIQLTEESVDNSFAESAQANE